MTTPRIQISRDLMRLPDNDLQKKNKKIIILYNIIDITLLYQIGYNRLEKL